MRHVTLTAAVAMTFVVACSGPVPMGPVNDAGVAADAAPAPTADAAAPVPMGPREGGPCETEGAFAPGHCDHACPPDAVHLECDGTVWQCVRVRPEQCMPDPEPTPDASTPAPDASVPDTSGDAGVPPMPTPDASVPDTRDGGPPVIVVVDDPAARLVLATQCLTGTVTVTEISPVATAYTTSVVTGGTETIFAPRFNEVDGRMRLQVFVDGRPQAVVSAGDCRSIISWPQIGLFDRASGEEVYWDFWPETVDGACAFTLARAYGTTPYYTLTDFRSEARSYCPAPTPTPDAGTPGTDAGRDAGSDAGSPPAPDAAMCTTERRYADRDSDGYGDPASYTVVCVGAPYDPAHPLAWSAGRDNDCDDGRASVHPGATEVCGNGLDDDCVGGDIMCPAPADRILYRLRVEQTGTDPYTRAAFDWGTMSNFRLADQWWSPVMCLNTGTTAMQSLGGGWYSCEVAARLTPFVGVFDSANYGPNMGTASVPGACRMSNGVTWEISYVTSHAAIATTATLGMTTVAGQCRHALPAAP